MSLTRATLNRLGPLLKPACNDALREAGASEEKALAALAGLPLPQHLASKEDLLQAIGEVKVEIADFRSAMETRLNDKFAPLDLGMAVLKYGYGPIIVGLLIKIAFF